MSSVSLGKLDRPGSCHYVQWLTRWIKNLRTTPDTLEGNLTKRTSSILPDSMDDANTMRAKVFEVYNACSDEAKANFTNILSEVKLWVQGIKSASDTAFQKYIGQNFAITWDMVYITQ